MNELSLFSGAGGGLLGAKLLGWRCVGYVEKDDYCQQVIKQRILDGILDDAQIFGDIRAFIDEGYAEAYRGMVDVVTAGFPCQPFSVAGKRQGEMDERNMWPHTIEALRRVRPGFALLENVPGLTAVRRELLYRIVQKDSGGKIGNVIEIYSCEIIRSSYALRILGDIAESGYDARWKIISAGEVGAPHRRDRLWIVANRQSKRGFAAEQPRQWNGIKPGREGLADSPSVQRPSVKRGEQDGVLSEGVAHADNATPARQRKHGGEIHAEPEPVRPECDGSPRKLADPIKQGLEEREGFGKDDGKKFTTAERSGRVWWWDTDPADLCDATEEGLQDGRGPQVGQPAGTESQPERPVCESGTPRPTEPRMGRVAHGVARRVDRLKAIGNGQVPAVVRAAWELLTQ